jgi:putative ABC transport system ATP-binding protein
MLNSQDEEKKMYRGQGSPGTDEGENAMDTRSTAPRAEAGPMMVQARNLTRVYPVGTLSVTGVDGIDMAIPAGRLVVLKGDSGSGKSTLLSLLGGLDRPTSGALTVAGRDLTHCGEGDLTRFRRDVVGMIFQTFNLLPTLDVMENICLPALLAGKAYTVVRERAARLLNWLGLDGRAAHRPQQLSGGEMQRTAIARALINDPDMVLADEPTGNLDSRNADKVMALLADLNRRFNRTVIIATHSTLADDHANMVLKLRDGRLVG